MSTRRSYRQQYSLEGSHAMSAEVNGRPGIPHWERARPGALSDRRFLRRLDTWGCGVSAGTERSQGVACGVGRCPFNQLCAEIR